MHICIYIEHTRHSLIQSQGSSKRTKSRDPCMYIQQIFSKYIPIRGQLQWSMYIYIYAHIMCIYICFSCAIGFPGGVRTALNFASGVYAHRFLAAWMPGLYHY